MHSRPERYSCKILFEAVPLAYPLGVVAHWSVSSTIGGTGLR
jgi:hypothetical protein